jgi:hypothetical protein
MDNYQYWKYHSRHFSRPLLYMLEDAQAEALAEALAEVLVEALAVFVEGKL